jgi:hypothetical protein
VLLLLLLLPFLPSNFKVPNFTFLSLSLLAERGILSIMWTMIYLSGLDPTSLKYTGLGLADRIRLGKPNKTP